MQDIIDGFLRFRREAFPQRTALYKQLATSQHPGTLFISCSDSRLVPELVTQQEPGDMFVIRNAGNIVPSYGPEPGGVSATIEYAVAALNVADIVICGHSDCGAMTAIASCECLDHMPAVASWLRYADSAKVVNEAREHRSTRDKVEVDGARECRRAAFQPQDASQRAARARARPAGAARLGLRYRKWLDRRARRRHEPLRPARRPSPRLCNASPAARRGLTSLH